jgi:tRNA splicing ligase
MTKYFFFLLALFVGRFCFSQQQKTTSNKILPISIYTAFFNVQTNNNTSYAAIKKNLKFPKKYNFITIYFEDIDANRFLISDKNFGTNTPKFIFDYKSYRDENLLKGFLQKYDPTRWSICNFMPQNID